MRKLEVTMVGSIKQTLAGLFAVLAVVTGVQGAITLRALVRIGQGVDRVERDLLPDVGVVHDIVHAVDRIRNKQYRLVLSTLDADVVANNIVELHDIEKELLDAQARYEPLISSPAERALYDGFVAAWTDYDRLTKPVEKLMQTGQGEAARQILLSPWLRVLYRNAEAKLARNVALSGKRAADEAAASVESVSRAKISAILTMLLAALLAAGAMLVSYLRVVRPLAGVTSVLHRLASGDVDPPILLPRRNDEIGGMVAALDVFRSSVLRMREAEKARQRTQLFFEQIAAATPDGIIGVNDDATISFSNAAAERLHGFGANEIVGQPITRLMPPNRPYGPEGAVQKLATLVGRTVESEIQHRDGAIIPVELSCGRWQQDGRDMFCAILRDGRARRANEEVMYRLAHLDPLTQLPNRTVLTARMGQALASGRPLAVLMTDLDRFKQVNDVLGHSTGDAVLRIAAARLLACVGETDTVTRIGGDEFVLMLPNVGDPLQAAAVAEAVIGSLSEPFTVEDRTIHLSASVGIALAPAHAGDADELLSCVDMALYGAKGDGRHCFRLFTPDLRQAALAENACRQELCRAVEQAEFTLFYQPQIRLADGELMGAEALIRWQHPQRGLLTPDKFLDVLENSRHAAEVGNWVIETACAQAAAWRAAGAPGFRMAVNLSSAQFRAGDLAETVRASLRRAGLPGSALEVEITENIILRHDDALTQPLRQLQEAGVGIAFDDYGTGYASLSLLKRFPLTRLKIDRSFVQGMKASPSDAAIIRAVLELGRSLGLEVIAEGIETAEQMKRLEHNNCVEGQGYLFGKPMPAADFAQRFGLAAAPVAASQAA